MITLIVVRHGDAVSHARTDSLRELSSRGRVEAEKVGRWLAESDLQLDRAIVSPYLRAQQTADAVLANASKQLVRETCEQVTPASNPETLDELLQNYLGETLLMVTHNPLASVLTNRLVYGEVYGPIAFGTGSIAVLQSEIIAPGLAQLAQFRNNHELD